MHAAPLPLLGKRHSGLPGSPALSVHLLLGAHGQPPPAGAHGGAGERGPALRVDPRGAKRCFDKGSCPGNQAQDVRNVQNTKAQPDVDLPGADH